MKGRLIAIKCFAIIAFLCLGNAKNQAQDLNKFDKKNPVTVNGNVTTGTAFYTAVGRENRRNPFAYYVTVSPTISVYGFDLPFNFSYRDQKGSLSHPFRRFDFNPTYKWATVGVGNTSLNLSPYTMSGQYFSGVSVQLSPKKIRFQAGVGNLENPLAQIDTIVEGTLILPSYKRKMVAMLLGIGSTDKFIDLIYFRAKDDITGTDLTTINKNLINPQENVVIGAKLGYPLSKLFSFKANFAGSVLSSNQEALPEFESTEEKKVVTTFKNVFNYNNSTQLQFAGDASVNFKLKKFGAGLEYKRVDPLYKSLGTYYFQEDYQNFTLKTNFSAFKNKFRFNGSGGIQKNNLNKLRSITRSRKIINTSVRLTPNQKFNVTLRLSNFQSNLTPVLTILNDSLKFTQTTESYGVVPVYIFKGKNGVNNTISVMFNYQKMIDLGLNLEGKDGVDNYLANVTYGTQLKEQGISLNSSLYFNKNIIGIRENQRLGFNVGGSKKIMDDKASASARLGMTSNSIDGSSDGATVNIGLGFRYKVKKKMNVSFNTNMLFRNSKIRSYQEYRGQFKVSYNFATNSKKS